MKRSTKSADTAHVEPGLAANPQTDSGNDPNGANHGCDFVGQKIGYATSDGGNNWTVPRTAEASISDYPTGTGSVFTSGTGWYYPNTGNNSAGADCSMVWWFPWSEATYGSTYTNSSGNTVDYPAYMARIYNNDVILGVSLNGPVQSNMTSAEWIDAWDYGNKPSTEDALQWSSDVPSCAGSCSSTWTGGQNGSWSDVFPVKFSSPMSEAGVQAGNGPQVVYDLAMNNSADAYLSQYFGGLVDNINYQSFDNVPLPDSSSASATPAGILFDQTPPTVTPTVTNLPASVPSGQTTYSAGISVAINDPGSCEGSSVDYIGDVNTALYPYGFYEGSGFCTPLGSGINPKSVSKFYYCAYPETDGSAQEAQCKTDIATALSGGTVASDLTAVSLTAPNNSSLFGCSTTYTAFSCSDGNYTASSLGTMQVGTSYVGAAFASDQVGEPSTPAWAYWIVDPSPSPPGGGGGSGSSSGNYYAG